MQKRIKCKRSIPIPRLHCGKMKATIEIIKSFNSGFFDPCFAKNHRLLKNAGVVAGRYGLATYWLQYKLSPYYKGTISELLSRVPRRYL